MVGSLNEDLRLRTRTVPAAGETVLGDPDWRLGGEGSDQAIAAARYGAAMLMIGRLGVDAGAEVPRCVRGRGDRLRTAEHQHGGRDRLGADRAGAGGGEPNHRRLRANLTLTVADVTGAAEQVRGAAVVLAQMEIPVDVVQAPFDIAGGTTVLNAAPARTLPVGLLAATNVLVVNGIELAMTTGLRGREPTDVAAILAACRSIPGPGAVIVTRGRPGAVVVDDGRATEIPAPEVDAIDTAGAGDCFCGVLAGALAEGEDLLDAARVAVRAASRAASRLGGG